MSEQLQAEGGSGLFSSAAGGGLPAGARRAKSPATGKKERVAKPLIDQPASSSPAEAKSQGAKPKAAGKREDARRRFLPPNALRFSAGVSFSAAVHLAFIILLGLWFLPSIVQPHFADLEARVLDRPEELLNQVLETEVDPAKTLALTSSSPVGSEGSLPIQGVSQPKFDRTVAEVSDAPSVNVGDLADFTSPASGFSLEVPEGTLGEPQAVVDSYQEAMDQITHEILHMLSKGKVLVIWCFDQSESMKDDQKEIRDRIERVYSELGLASVAGGDALMGAVTSYGGEFKIHTPKPTADIEEVKAAIGEVPIDPSGKEQMCSAVGYSIAAFHKYATSGRRQLALILVTDESGEDDDNRQTLEAAIQEARSARCAVYALGREAVFGYPYAHMRWVDPETKIHFWLRINRGPETPEPEQLQIDGFTRRWDAHPSGFGPYEQVRLARETGGVFFMLPSGEVNLVARDDRKYELDKMRPYLPDLGSRAEYTKQRDKSKLRSALWQIIVDLNPYNPKSSKYCTVQVRFPIDRQEFAKAAGENQQIARGMHEYLVQAEKTLDKVKPWRSREKSFRWQASYDLMYAQVITYQVRIQEYAAYLADFVKKPKEIKNSLGKDKPTNHWEIRTRAQTITGDKTKEDVEQATALLKEIVRQHPGTPYAARAQWELHRGFGVELVEWYRDPRENTVKKPNF